MGFYLFVRGPRLFCSTAQKQELFTGPWEFHEKFGAILHNPVRACCFKFSVTRGRAQRHDASSRRFARADTGWRILNDDTFRRRGSQELRSP